MISSIKCELVNRRSFRSREQARMACFDYIEAFYNPRRRHSALGYLAPAEFERRHAEAESGQAITPTALAEGLRSPLVSAA